MGFMDSYKHLEKLCGEVMGDVRCISAYIDEMLKTPNGSRLVRGWDNDLKQLKHYRWVRNQIVHDPLCTEENMCSDDDTIWIDGFYLRIMRRSDPLALYYQATKPAAVHKRSQSIITSAQSSPHPREDHNYSPQKPYTTAGVIIFLLCIIIAVMVILVVGYT